MTIYPPTAPAVTPWIQAGGRAETPNSATLLPVPDLHTGDIVIRKVENGFLVIIGMSRYAQGRVFVAENFDEVAEILKVEAVKTALAGAGDAAKKG